MLWQLLRQIAIDERYAVGRRRIARGISSALLQRQMRHGKGVVQHH